MALKFPVRDPRDLSDYLFDWEEFLTSEDGEKGVIASATVGIADGDDALVITGQLVGQQSVLVDLEGGTVGKTYTLTCEVTLVDGRRFNRSAKVSVKDL